MWWSNAKKKDMTCGNSAKLTRYTEFKLNSSKLFSETIIYSTKISLCESRTHLQFKLYSCRQIFSAQELNSWKHKLTCIPAALAWSPSSHGDPCPCFACIRLILSLCCTHGVYLIHSRYIQFSSAHKRLKKLSGWKWSYFSHDLYNQVEPYVESIKDI